MTDTLLLVLQKRYDLSVSLLSYAGRRVLVDMWCAELHTLLRQMQERNRAFVALGGAITYEAVSDAIRISGGGKAYFQVDHSYNLRLTVESGIVPAPDPLTLVAMQLDTADSLMQAQDAVDDLAERIRSWL